MLVPRLLAIAAVAVLLLGLIYAGYINELLKGAIGPWHRGALMIGFIIGVGAAARYLTSLALTRRRRVKQGHS